MAEKVNKNAVKQAIIEVGKKLWIREYVAANDGNISVRLPGGTILTTPTGVSKGALTKRMIIEVDETGRVISRGGRYQPSSELKMHLEVYKNRSDVNAVIHAHPAYSTSFAVAGIPLNQYVLPEAIIHLGTVPLAKYGTPSTTELSDSITPYLSKCNVMLLANHGVLTLGSDLEKAYFMMETIEHSARIYSLAMRLGNVNMLGDEEIKKLIQLRKNLKVSSRAFYEKTCEENANRKK